MLIFWWCLDCIHDFIYNFKNSKGRDISVMELSKLYSGIIFATGA